MNYDWENLLTEFDKKFLEAEIILNNFFYTTQRPLTLIISPSSDVEISELEKRICFELPPSYKQFLKVTNGFKVVNQFFGNLFQVNLVQPLIKFDPDFVDIWTRNDFEVSDETYFNYDETQRTEWIRSNYSKDCIAISDWFDGGIILLNPNIKFSEEFEAWAFANWYPGAVRYKSFWDLIKGEFNTYLEIKNK